MAKESSKIGFVTFVGIVMAMVATVRSIPTLAAASWQMIFLDDLCSFVLCSSSFIDVW